MSDIRTELVNFHTRWGRLPGSKLTQMITFPHIYSLDTLSAAVHSQVLDLYVSEESLSEMETAFLNMFQSRYNY